MSLCPLLFVRRGGQEAYEREWRAREKAEAEHQRELNKALITAREQQKTFKLRQLAEMAEQERGEFYSILKTQKQASVGPTVGGQTPSIFSLVLNTIISKRSFRLGWAGLPAERVRRRASAERSPTGSPPAQAGNPRPDCTPRGEDAQGKTGTAQKSKHSYSYCWRIYTKWAVNSLFPYLQDFLEEGRRLREAQSKERALLEAIKMKKIHELQVEGVPAKYRAELERNNNF